MTDVEYQQLIEAARWTTCASCEKPARRDSEWIDGDKVYCSDRCYQAAEIARAPLDKRQPVGVVLGGRWDI
jgi:hypothetical protein